ncbi:hypothetical protein MLD38_003585 [Melastoma candidum]|uniref:Uncharacterized protein n=1 Tax=Melastoma candidum TaxID=119954 RepID=A0ACB9S2J0_9MYRT|nr:hypothetical protein MLD38_003585 [Melastoma candidum]
MASHDVPGPKPRGLLGDRVLVQPRQSRVAFQAGDYLRTWRRRLFVLKQGRLLWFKDPFVNRLSVPRGVIPIVNCLTVKGIEDVVNKPFAFEISTHHDTMFFIADFEKEEELINSIGSIVQLSRSVTDSEVSGYDSKC